MARTGTIHVGTSGWEYEHWRGPFYPEDLGSEARLRFYADHLQTVEINRTFYSLPSTEAVARWADAVPRDFRFVVKGSRWITHMKKLKEPEEPLRRLYEVVDALGSKGGPVLFQLPPRWHLDPERLGAFLKALPTSHRVAFEFRDRTWFDPRVLDLLRDRDAAFCIWELAGELSPREVTTDLVYIRLHGPGDAYEGRYDRQTLAGWAGACSSWAASGRDVWCFFDNDQKGFAVANAIELREMLEG
jgi:uncharacterized protein YecE (DUF72 family)